MKNANCVVAILQKYKIESNSQQMYDFEIIGNVVAILQKYKIESNSQPITFTINPPLCCCYTAKIQN